MSAVLPLASALLLSFTGWIVAQRDVRATSRPALLAFAAWWHATAAVLFLVGARTLVYLAGVRELAVYTVLRNLLAIPLSLALASLLFYLIYIYSGRRRAIWPVAFFYLGFLVFALHYFSLARPIGLHATLWQVRIVTEGAPADWTTALFGALVAAPILIALVAYASLYRHVPPGEQRSRILLVSVAFFMLFAPLLLAFLLGWNRSEWFPLVYEVPGIFAAGIILVAYRPPRFLRRRWEGRAAMEANG